MAKHYLIIGGSKGIGKAFVKACLSKGIKVTMIARTPLKVKKSNNLVCFEQDLSDIEGLQLLLKRIVKERGAIHTLSFFQKFRPKSEESSLEEALRVGLVCTSMIIEFMKEHFVLGSSKSIVLIGSVAAARVAFEQDVGYHIVKSGLMGLMRYYAYMLGERGIRVNALSPSTVLKEENQAFYRQNKALSELYCSLSPFNRMVESNDIVQMLFLLHSKKSRSVTGQDIVVDNGLTLAWSESLARKLKCLDQIKVTQKG